MSAPYGYDVAFSFAGEDRQMVKSLALRLKQPFTIAIGRLNVGAKTYRRY